MLARDSHEGARVPRVATNEATSFEMEPMMIYSATTVPYLCPVEPVVFVESLDSAMIAG